MNKWMTYCYIHPHTHTHTCTYISTVIFSYTYTCMIYVGIASACPNYLFVSSEIFSGFTWYVGSKFAMQKISLVERGMNKESKVYWTAITQLPITFTTLRQLRVVSECSILWLLHAVGGMLCCIFLLFFQDRRENSSSVRCYYVSQELMINDVAVDDGHKTSCRGNSVN